MDPLKFFNHDGLPFRQLQKRNSLKKNQNLLSWKADSVQQFQAAVRRRERARLRSQRVSGSTLGAQRKASSLSLLETDVAAQGPSSWSRSA